MIDPTTKPADVTKQFIDRLRELGVHGLIQLTVNGHEFRGVFDAGGSEENAFTWCQTWGDVEAEAVAYVAGLKPPMIGAKR